LSQTTPPGGTDYYVATHGSNSETGLSPDHAWGTPSYAVSQVRAGDTIYLLDGIWINEELIFSTNGTKENPITLTAYNGRPILDGVGKDGTAITIKSSESSMNYININGIEIRRYDHGIFLDQSHHINITDIEVWDMKNTAVTFCDCQYCTLKDSDIHDTNWNTIQVATKRLWTHDIKIINNNIYDNPGVSGSTGHALIDLFNVPVGDKLNLTDIEISGNNIYNAWQAAIFTHGLENQHMYRIIIDNNTFHDTYGVAVSYLEDSIISNNMIYNNYPWGFYTVPPVNVHDNVTFIGNNVSVKQDGIQYWINPGRQAKVSIVEDKSYFYRIDYGHVVIQDINRESFLISTEYNGKITLQFTDGRVFSENGRNSITYYPNRSEYITNGDETVAITVYPISASPASDSATVIINKFDISLSKGDILFDFNADTIDGNKITFAISSLKPGAVYKINKNGISFTESRADSDGTISFCNSRWPADSFTIIKKYGR